MSNRLTQLLDQPPQVFDGPKPDLGRAARHDQPAHAGERFLEGTLTKAGLVSVKAMIDRAHELPVCRQCQALELLRSMA